MSRMKRKKLTLTTEREREALFMDVIGHLNRYNDMEKKNIAEEAEVHWTTIYNWCAFKTVAPRIDTLARVARAMGYDIVLKRARSPKAILRRIK